MKCDELQRKIVTYVKEQIGVDLNEYRDGDGTSPYTTSYWDKGKPAICVNWCGSTGGMSKAVQDKIMNLTNKGRIRAEWGGGWFKYIWLEGES